MTATTQQEVLDALITFGREMFERGRRAGHEGFQDVMPGSDSESEYARIGRVVIPEAQKVFSGSVRQWGITIFKAARK